MIEQPGRKSTEKKQNVPARFIKTTNVTDDGEFAERKVCEFALDKIRDEEKYDGFYAVIKNLEGNIGEILKINRQCWEIEENFRIMKKDFGARPVYAMRVTLLSKESGCIPSYMRTELTDDLHRAFGFHTYYEFISKSAMRSIIKSYLLDFSQDN